MQEDFLEEAILGTVLKKIEVADTNREESAHANTQTIGLVSETGSGLLRFIT